MSNDSNDASRHPVDLLADDFSRRIRDGEQPSIEEYCLRNPEHAELIRKIFPSIAMVEKISQKDEANRLSRSSSPFATRQNSIPESLGDYKIVREIGRGGMGVVYEAIQQSLNRNVALKVINSMVSANEKHRARFQREAESAASLHHTNIVQIFGIGEDNGLQYYAMQLIEGVPLSDVIASLRHDELRVSSVSEIGSQNKNALFAPDSTSAKLPFGSTQAAQLLLNCSKNYSVFSPTDFASEARVAGKIQTMDIASATVPMTVPEHVGTEPISESSIQSEADMIQARRTSQPVALTREYFRNIARIIANAANAIDYAHRQHILHRDIKPANLLLDHEGTIWITDFGLARRTDLDGATQSGEVLGTLRYMAPEQIAGHGDSRMDIYSLGLTLFELLTLRPAIESPKKRLLDPERNSIIPSLRAINPAIPHDLQTITLKASAYAPNERYQTAGEFEADLRRFLEDRPILARRTSWLESTIRWARRNPAIATLASLAGSLLLFIAGLLAIWNQQQRYSLNRIETEFNRAEQNLRDKTLAFEAVQKERLRAENNLEIAIQAFDKIADNIADRGRTSFDSSELDSDDSIDMSGTELSQADVRLLETLLDFFDRFGAENEKDLRIETAKAKQRVGDIQHKIGKIDEAEQSYRSAMQAFDLMRRQYPERNDILLSQMAIVNEMIVICAKRRQPVRIEQLLREARRLLDLNSSFAQSTEGRFALAKLLNSAGILSARVAADPSRRPINALQRLLGGLPPGGLNAPVGNAPPALESNGEPPDGPPLNRGINNATVNRMRQQVSWNHESQKLLEGLIAEEANKVSYKLLYARTLRDEARISTAMRDVPTAERALMRSIELLENLCKSHPEAAVLQFELAETLSTSIAKPFEDAQRFHRSLGLCDDLLKSEPTSPEYLSLKASVLFQLAALVPPNPNRNIRAEENLLEAMRIQRGLSERFPDITMYKIALAKTLAQLYDVEIRMKQADRAADHLAEAKRIIDSLGLLPNGARGPFSDRLNDPMRELQDRRQRMNNSGQDFNSK